MRVPAIILISLLAAGIVAEDSVCPDVATIQKKIQQAQPARGARTASFNQPVPEALYERAIAEPGKAFSKRDGNKMTGVMLVPMAADRLWRAINDEPHAEEFLPVNYSTVIEGAARSSDRVLFQYVKKAGLGRWWASRIRINAKLHEVSEGRLWEMSWVDWMDEVDRTKPPIRDIADDLKPIVESKGAWLLMPVSESCTLAEHYSESEAGGALGALQVLVASGAIRDTLNGVKRMAEEHRCPADESAPFHGPDGKSK